VKAFPHWCMYKRTENAFLFKFAHTVTRPESSGTKCSDSWLGRLMLGYSWRTTLRSELCTRSLSL
jgi:hypothetical protein